ncbi:MAG: family 16 glycoside hydrolase [Planctomycetota bacterium]
MRMKPISMLYSFVLICILSCSGCASAAQTNKLSPEEKKQGFKLLFDGKSMDQWRNYKSKTIRPKWQVIDGAMVLTEKGGKDIVTKEKFDYFDLRLQWTIAEGGNSGIMFRVDEQTTKRLPWMVAPEYQLKDPYGKPRKSAGALYGLVGAPKGIAKKPGEWNNTRILITPLNQSIGHLQFWLNGTKTIDLVIDHAPGSEWSKLVAKRNAETKGTKFELPPEFFKTETGPILLQDHGARVAFRNIRIRKLPTAVFAQTKVILDTDIGSDCDDAGAMAVLHKLADKGEVKILGIIYSSGKNKFGIGVCDAINTYYGRGDLPLGQNLNDDVGDPRDFFSKQIATDTSTYHHDVINSAMDLVSLEKEQDAGVTIVTVGHPIGLVHLLRDDEGVRLVKSRVSRWVAMGTGGWNFSKNGMAEYMPELLKKWPCELYLSGYGAKVITGNIKLPRTPKNNPVRTAYESFIWNCLEKGRPSWDQIAVLFAARPQYFKIESHGFVEQTEDKSVRWNNKKNNPKHHWVLPKISDAEMRDIIEDLMSRKPDSAKQTG